jgi:NADH-quinone oxidoreductase subunit H
MSFFVLVSLIQIIFLFILLLLSVAFLTLAERKILATIQRRQGPNVFGIFGLFQPLADGFKLLMKETINPSSSNKFLFIIAPLISFLISLAGWGVIPYAEKATFADINVAILYILSVSSLGVYGVIISGWSSNSKYAFLGALRSSAQMISYELSIGFSILSVVVCSGCLNLNGIVEAQRYVWYCIPLPVPCLIFFIAGLAETNRHPFDLPEAESELVSGYNVEYSAMGFALFSLAEYSNILFMCSLNAIFFFGGWQPPFQFLSFIPGVFWLSFKIIFFFVLFVCARGILPRYRYDQLMHIGWKVLLPASFGYLLFVISIVYTFNIYPY